MPVSYWGRPSAAVPSVFDAPIRQWRRSVGDPHWQHAGCVANAVNQPPVGEGTAIPVLLTGVHSSKLAVQLSPTAIKHETWDNLAGDGVGTYKADLSDEITTGTSTSWERTQSESTTTTESTEVKVNVGVEFEGVSAGGETAYTFSTAHEVGQSSSQGGGHTEERSIGTSSGIDYALDPGKAAVAVLVLNSGTLKARVAYGYVPHLPTYNVHSDPGGTETIADRLPWGYTGHFRVSGVETEEGPMKWGNVAVAALPAIPPELVLTLTCDFVAEDVIRVVEVDDLHPQTVEQAIERAVQGATVAAEYHRPRAGVDAWQRRA